MGDHRRSSLAPHTLSAAANPAPLRSAPHVYDDLKEAETLLRAQRAWLKNIYVKPGALSVDRRRGHALSLAEEDSPLSYLDLAAAMVEAADDQGRRYDRRNVSVLKTNRRAKFPIGTPMCILMGVFTPFFLITVSVLASDRTSMGFDCLIHL